MIGDSKEIGLEDQTLMISEYADIVYQEVGKKHGIPLSEVHHSRRCEDVAEGLAKKITDQGKSVNLYQHSGWDITSHQFLGLLDTKGEIIIDPTWQQFLDSPNPNLPRVLIAKKDRLKQKLDELGIPESKHNMWVKAQIRPSS